VIDIVRAQIAELFNPFYRPLVTGSTVAKFLEGIAGEHTAGAEGGNKDEVQELCIQLFASGT
jgi:hypothetical protein